MKVDRNKLGSCLSAQFNTSLQLKIFNGTASASDYQFHQDCREMLDTFYEMQSTNDRYTRELITFYLMGVAAVMVCCFGFVGNLISMVVLTRRTMHTSTYTYLAGLAVTDFFVDLFTFALLIKDMQIPDEMNSNWSLEIGGIYPYLFPYLHPAAFTLQVASVWLTLAFTVDRYIMICHPFHAEPFCKVKRARVVVAALVAASVLFNLPKFFEYRTVEIAMSEDVIHIGCDLTEFGSSRIFKELFHSWFYIFFVFGVPFISLAILNAFLVHAVRMSRKRGREMNSAESKRLDTTIMLIGVVVIFFLCQLPALVSRSIWAFVENPSKAFTRLPLYTLNEIANFLVIFNSSVNIVPYYFFGKRFRNEFIYLFCGVCRRLSSGKWAPRASTRDSNDIY